MVILRRSLLLHSSQSQWALQREKKTKWIINRNLRCTCLITEDNEQNDPFNSFHVAVLHHQFIEISNDAFVRLRPSFVSSQPIAAVWLLFRTPEAWARLPPGPGPSRSWWWSGCCRPWSPHGPETERVRVRVRGPCKVHHRPFFHSHKRAGRACPVHRHTCVHCPCEPVLPRTLVTCGGERCLEAAIADSSRSFSGRSEASRRLASEN